MWVLDELLKHFLEELQAKESYLSYLENQNTESEKTSMVLLPAVFFLKIGNEKLRNQDVFLV